MMNTIGDERERLVVALTGGQGEQWMEDVRQILTMGNRWGDRNLHRAVETMTVHGVCIVFV